MFFYLKTMIDVYIFDCDGVIIDSGTDIADGVNAALRNFGYWTLPQADIISFVGDGAKMLILRALMASTKNHFNQDNVQELEKVYSWYLDYYHSHAVIKTTLYAGIKELLKVLKQKNKKIGMLTNKPGNIARKILHQLDVEQFFDVITGPEDIFNKKPDPEGLSFTVTKINELYGTNYTNQNVIMIGDSKVDIQAGKAYGCKTCACRGGLGNTQELLAQNADLCFSVASEIEKFIDILSMNPDEYTWMQKFAMKNEVPIMIDEGSDFICDYIIKNNIKTILEIGSAIGYSSIKFAKLNDEIKVTTIEIDKDRYTAACKNIQDNDLTNRITIYHGDALTYPIEGKYDLIFIDAAKAQYIKFFERYKENLTQDGVIISDNLSFHGMVEDLSLTHNYSTIKLVKKIRKYIDFLKTNSEFDTTFYKVGDGVSISKKV